MLKKFAQGQVVWLTGTNNDYEMREGNNDTEK
jgi:hypothetical protein